MTRLRICYFADGTSVHTHRWIAYFVEAGHTVHLASWEPYSGRERGVVTHDLRAIAGAPFTRAVPRVRAAEWVLRIRRAARRVVREATPDIVHGHFVRGYGHLAWLSGVRPLVLTAWGSDIFGYRSQGWVSRRLTRRALSAADAVTCDSEALARATAGIGAAPGRIRIVQLGVETDRFRPGLDASALRGELGLAEDARVILMARGISPRYHADAAIRALAGVRKSVGEAVLILAGPGEANERDGVRALAARLGVGDSTLVLGRIPHERMPSLVSLSEVVLSLAESDSSPVSVLEALACGRLVVASDLPGLREWIEDGVNGFLADPRDSGFLSNRLAEALALDAGKKAKWAERNRSNVQQRAEYSVNMSSVEEMYRRLSP